MKLSAKYKIFWFLQGFTSVFSIFPGKAERRFKSNTEIEKLSWDIISKNLKAASTKKITEIEHRHGRLKHQQSR